MEDKKYWIGASILKIKPSKLYKFIEKTENIENLFNLPVDELVKKGIDQKSAEKIKNIKTINWEKEVEYAIKNDIKIITIKDKEYPPLLKQIYDPPYILYVKGKIENHPFPIAMVGTRNPSYYGIKMAEKFSFQLSSLGITIVSGLARGIDYICHYGAIKSKGKTVGVLGSGFDNFYPKENIKLVDKIVELGGAIITEFPSSVLPEKWNFPIRNRIIAGMSKGVIVVEAGPRSGAIITANIAISEGRDVFALPGQADNITSKGTNKLLKDGAILIQDISDILEELNIEIKEQEKKEEKEKIVKNIDEEEKKVLSFINGKVNIEQLLKLTGMDYPCLSTILLKLELKGIIKELPGKNYELL